jgi:small GTP-binding protein
MENNNTTYNYNKISYEFYPVKLTLLGDHKVGKSSFIYKFLLGSIPINISPTIGIETCTKIYNEFEINFWDTAGIEKYRADVTSQLRLSDIIFLCFDLSLEETFENVKNYFYAIKDKLKSSNLCVVVLVALKADKCATPDSEVYSAIDSFITQENIFYCETSIFFEDDFIYKQISLEDCEDIKKDKENFILYNNLGVSKENFINIITEGDHRDYRDQTNLKTNFKTNFNTAVSTPYVTPLASHRKMKTYYYRGGINVLMDYTITQIRKKLNIHTGNNIDACDKLEKKFKSTIKISDEKIKSNFCACRNNCY